MSKKNQPNIWVTANTRFGRRTYLGKFPNIEGIILSLINENVKEDDVLIVCGGLLGDVSGISWLHSIVCKNRILLSNEKDKEFSAYIKPFFSIYDSAIFAEIAGTEVVLAHDADVCLEHLTKQRIAICGSGVDDWKRDRIERNLYNATVDLWNFKPINLEQLT